MIQVILLFIVYHRIVVKWLYWIKWWAPVLFFISSFSFDRLQTKFYQNVGEPPKKDRGDEQQASQQQQIFYVEEI